jgi:hypothetical protein
MIGHGAMECPIGKVGGLNVGSISTPVPQVVVPRILNVRPVERTSATSRKASGGALVWVFLLAAASAGGFWAWQHPDDVNRLVDEGKRFFEKTTEPSPAQPAPEQEVAATANTAKSVALGTPKPVETISSTPPPQQQQVKPPQPLAVDLSALATMPSRWPKTITLMKSVNYPIVLDGRLAGSVALPRGTILSLKAIKAGKLIVMHQNTIATISAQDTDLVDRLSKVATAAQAMGPAVAADVK